MVLRFVCFCLLCLVAFGSLASCSATGGDHPLEYQGDSNFDSLNLTPSTPGLLDFIPRSLDEIRLGTSMHDAGLTGQTFESGADGNFEVYFKPLPQTIKALGKPRPHLGLSCNNEGGTNQVFSGLTWTTALYGKIFGGLSLGLAAHDGQLETRRKDAKGLGSTVLFRTAVEVGYRFGNTHHIAIVADHISNAGLAAVNEGMDTLGIRFGYSF